MHRAPGDISSSVGSSIPRSSTMPRKRDSAPTFSAMPTDDRAFVPDHLPCAHEPNGHAMTSLPWRAVAGATGSACAHRLVPLLTQRHCRHGSSTRWMILPGLRLMTSRPLSIGCEPRRDVARAHAGDARLRGWIGPSWDVARRAELRDVERAHRISKDAKPAIFGDIPCDAERVLAR